MDEHFRAFSFVNRIISVQTGIRIRGGYSIPPDIGAFPPSLVAEAVGQLAAWTAMAAVDFKSRPVAGLASSIKLLAPVRPGHSLELAAEIESVDAEAVAYSGTASADGVPVIRLQHCVGPMVPLADFDDPQVVRDRFALLCNSGSEPGGFAGVPALTLDRIGNETSQWTRATLHVPASAAFFADHFPRRAVFPGTLLMHANLQLASTLAAEIPAPANGAVWNLRQISNVKLRTFTPPGEVLEIEARLNEISGNTATLAVETRKGKRVVGSARVVFATEKNA